MINDFISIIDRVIDLLKQKEISKKKYFDEFIEPLFVEYEEVVDKYLQLTSSESIEELNQVRDSYIQARIKISGFVKTYLRAEINRDFIELLDCIQSFFFQPGNGARSEGADYIDEIICSSKHNQHKIKEYFRNQQLETWRYSVEAYSELKLKYKSPFTLA